MLKLEKVSREGTISVIVRDKEHLFTRPFALAFGIALIIHLSLILIFHIAPFKIGITDTVFPPTSVEADTMILKESAIALIEPVIQTIKGLPIPPSSSPTTTEPYFSKEHPIEYRKEETSTVSAFNLLEKEIYQPVFHSIDIQQKPPLEILISGALADQPLLSSSFKDKIIPLLITSTDLRITYSVMVEGRTGKIFWFEPKQVAHIASLDHFSEMILRDMKFVPDAKNLILSGEIEFHFNQRLK